MTDKPRRADQRREALAIALVNGLTYEDAASHVGIALATAYRWAKEPSFRAMMSRIQEALTEAAINALSQAQGQAVTTLVALMSTGKTESVRCRAAVEILNLAARFREERELKAQIATLEAQVEALEGNKVPVW